MKVICQHIVIKLEREADGYCKDWEMFESTHLSFLQISLLQDDLNALLPIRCAKLVLQRALRCAIILSLSSVPTIVIRQPLHSSWWGDFGKLGNGTHLCVTKILNELTTCARGVLLSFLHFRTSSALSAKTMKSSSLPLKWTLLWVPSPRAMMIDVWNGVDFVW